MIKLVKYKYTGSDTMTFYIGENNEKSYTVSVDDPIVELPEDCATLTVAGMELVKERDKTPIKKRKSKVGD